MKWRLLMWVLWPSFLAAGIAEVVIFSVLDPSELVVFGKHLGASREAVYSIGFFVLWAVCAISSAITLTVLPGSAKEWAERADLNGGLE